MNNINAWINGRWTIPALSGLLILASFTASKGYGAATAGDLLMVAAAIVAGLPVVRNAIRALAVRHISIDLLVSIAASYAKATSVFCFVRCVALKACTESLRMVELIIIKFRLRVMMRRIA